MPIEIRRDGAQSTYQSTRRAHWDAVEKTSDGWHGVGGYYHRRLIDVYQFLVTPGQSIIELGCGRGDLLAALKPSTGVGVDFSSEAIRRARTRHPSLEFIESDVHDVDVDRSFDVVILSDLVNDLWDVQTVLERVGRLSHPRTRIILNWFSHLWGGAFAAAKALRLK